MTVALKLLAAYVLSQLPDFRQKNIGEPHSRNLRRSLRGAEVFVLLAIVFCLPELTGWSLSTGACSGSSELAHAYQHERTYASLSGGIIALLIVTGALIRLVLGGLLWRLRTWYLLIIAEAAQLGLLAGFVSFRLQQPSLGISFFDIWSSPRFFGLIAVYVLSVGLGGAIVPLVTSRLGTQANNEDDDSLRGAGHYIGMLERLIITTLIIHLPRFDTAAIGLVFAAKSIARFPEFKKTSFAEYYLVGSLTSIAVAVFAGLTARYYLP